MKLICRLLIATAIFLGIFGGFGIGQFLRAERLKKQLDRAIKIAEESQQLARTAQKIAIGCFESEEKK